MEETENEKLESIVLFGVYSIVFGLATALVLRIYFKKETEEMRAIRASARYTTTQEYMNERWIKDNVIEDNPEK